MTPRRLLRSHNSATAKAAGWDVLTGWRPVGRVRHADAPSGSNRNEVHRRNRLELCVTSSWEGAHDERGLAAAWGRYRTRSSRVRRVARWRSNWGGDRVLGVDSSGIHGPR